MPHNVTIHVIYAANKQTNKKKTKEKSPHQIYSKISHSGDLPGGPMVKNSPCNAENAGLIPGGGIKIPHATGQLGSHATRKK